MAYERKRYPGFVFYVSWADAVAELSDEQLGMVTRCLFLYAESDGEREYEPQDPIARMVYKTFIGSVRNDMEKYRATCEARQKARLAGIDKSRQVPTNDDNEPINTSQYKTNQSNPTQNNTGGEGE